MSNQEWHSQEKMGTRAMMVRRNPKCAILYLDRFSNKVHFPRVFIKSLSKFSPGADFDYIHILKGFKQDDEIRRIKSLSKIGVEPIRFVSVDDAKLPTATFLEAARQIDHEKIITFVSWSRILAQNWLKFYIDAFASDPNIGIVGATSGYERQDSRDLAAPFPNIGIRTNAFMIDRRLYMELAANVLSRSDELDFESGPNSLTKQIIRRGLRPVVVDRCGNVWEASDWPQSRTFRSGNQEGLLVADNRTHHYDRARSKKRKKLAKITWGDEGFAEPNSLLRRTWVNIKWKHLGA